MPLDGLQNKFLYPHPPAINCNAQDGGKCRASADHVVFTYFYYKSTRISNFDQRSLNFAQQNYNLNYFFLKVIMFLMKKRLVHAT